MATASTKLTFESPSERRQFVVRQRAAGKTYQEIGKMLGISAQRATQLNSLELMYRGREKSSAAGEPSQS